MRKALFVVIAVAMATAGWGTEYHASPGASSVAKYEHDGGSSRKTIQQTCPGPRGIRGRRGSRGPVGRPGRGLNMPELVARVPLTQAMVKESKDWWKTAGEDEDWKKSFNILSKKYSWGVTADEWLSKFEGESSSYATWKEVAEKNGMKTLLDNLNKLEERPMPLPAVGVFLGGSWETSSKSSSRLLFSGQQGLPGVGVREWGGNSDVLPGLYLSLEEGRFLHFQLGWRGECFIFVGQWSGEMRETEKVEVVEEITSALGKRDGDFFEAFSEAVADTAVVEGLKENDKIQKKRLEKIEAFLGISDNGEEGDGGSAGGDGVNANAEDSGFWAGVKKFFAQHWKVLLIILAVVLLLYLLWWLIWGRRSDEVDEVDEEE